MVGQRAPEDMLPNDMDTVASQAGSDDSAPPPGSGSSGPPSLADVVEWEFSDDSEQVDRAHAPHQRGAGTYNELPSFEDLQARAVEEAGAYFITNTRAVPIGNFEVAAAEEVTGLREVDPEAIATLSASMERAGWRPGQPMTADGGHRTYANAQAPPLGPPLGPHLNGNHRAWMVRQARWEYFQDRERAREEGHHLLHIDGADQSDFVLPWVQRPPGRNPPE